MQVVIFIIQLLLVLVALGVVVAVLMQQGNSAGLGAIGGGAETFFGKNQSKTMEGKLAFATKIGVAVFVVLSIILTAIK